MRSFTVISAVFLSVAGLVASAPVAMPGPTPAPYDPNSIQGRDAMPNDLEPRKKKTTTTKKKTTTKKAAAAAPTVKLSTSESSFTGRATFYYQNGVAGSCGKVNSDSAIIVAVNTPQVANGAHCGQHVTITNKSNGKTVRALVADECPGCGYGSLDLSTGAFNEIGAEDTGVLPITWHWS